MYTIDALLVFSWSDTCWERRIWRTDTFWFCSGYAEISKEPLSVTEVQNHFGYWNTAF